MYNTPTPAPIPAAAAANAPPQDPVVVYFSEFCVSSEEGRRLEDIHRRVLEYGPGVGPADLARWSGEKKLLAMITRVMFGLAPAHRGTNLPWFRKSFAPRVKSRAQDQEDATEDPVRLLGVLELFDRGRMFLPEEDQIKSKESIRPYVKWDLVNLFVNAEDDKGNGDSPTPDLSCYWDFGFVTCRNKSERSKLADLYRRLFKEIKTVDAKLKKGKLAAPQPITFANFARATLVGAIPTFFASASQSLAKDFEASFPASTHPIHEFLSVYLDGFRPTVWRLKQAMEWPVEEIEVPLLVEVEVHDWLPASIKNEERHIWGPMLEIYEGLLHDPMELHRQRKAGTLVEYAEGLGRVSNEVRQVLLSLPPIEQAAKIIKRPIKQ